ncbi:UNVERIFIED_CONTAM: hypothetical protein GTU68_045353 [Idotea baltica]|nr:hypothetical protein [Idotea baltica]
MEFELFEDQMDKYEYIIDLGKQAGALDEQYKIESNVVKGCQSTVWLHARGEGDFMIFQADSNTVITRGIIAILVRILSGQRAEHILNDDFQFIEKIGLRAHLSSQRSNGLTAMMNRMKVEAALYLEQKNNL